jgi:hypothetical protein
MAKPYSMDLRERVVEAVERDGLSLQAGGGSLRRGDQGYQSDRIAHACPLTESLPSAATGARADSLWGLRGSLVPHSSR